MIVPRTRLLLWVAMVVLPFALLAAAEPSAVYVSVAATSALFLLVALDALSVRVQLKEISIELPLVARMSKDRNAKLEVRIRNQGSRAGTVRLALALPREFSSSQEEALVALPPNSEWSRLVWNCRPDKRGRYRLETARLETGSRFGFWNARKTVPARAELRVYPNLFRDRRDLASLFLHRGALGLHAQRQLGKGREFEKLREYIPGDSFEEIHWKATARRARPITKVFQLERTQEIYVIIDASRLSARPLNKCANAVDRRMTADHVVLPPPQDEQKPSDRAPESETTLERFITAALVLGLAAEQQGDLFGLLTFTDKVHDFIRARNGKAHYSACRDALYVLEPELVSPDYDEVCTFIRLRLRRRALLIFLTALDDPVLAESFTRNMELIRGQHFVLVNMLEPAGVAPLFSNPDVSTTDDLYQQLGGHLLWQSLRELEKVLQRRGVRFSLLKNERLSTELVAQYFEVKRRQAL